MFACDSLWKDRLASHAELIQLR